MYAQTAYGYATVALAARSEPEWDPAHEDPDGLLVEEPEDEEDRDAPSLDEAFGAPVETYCLDWPHRYVCPECAGNSCRACSGGEREDPSPCRH